MVTLVTDKLNSQWLWDVWMPNVIINLPSSSYNHKTVFFVRVITNALQWCGKEVVFSMQACAQQLNDATGAPFYNLLYIPWTWVYKMVAPTYITLQYVQWGAQNWITWQISVFDPCIYLDESGFQFQYLITNQKCINVMSLEGVEGVYLGVHCEAFEDFVRTTMLPSRAATTWLKFMSYVM